MDDIIEPPFQETYPTLFENFSEKAGDESWFGMDDVEYCELPQIDLSRLHFWNLENDEDGSHSEDFDKCRKEMAEAASEWGFFQVVNHGIPQKVIKNMKYEQKKLFHQPFCKKAEESFMNLSANSYRWGNPTATCLRQFSWSEAFHIPHTDISRLDECNRTRFYIYRFVIRLNIKYWVVCNKSCEFGSKALSNGVYRSIEHRVVAHSEVERFSAAYFYCPSHEAVIESFSKPAVYRKFSFKEYRQQVQKDVRATGDKIGLSRFLL
ncbi:hypothetical protein Pint_04248 [Pistacia integerrima]|uniref:Uncharacterized protein n=1 Tax=Pistacia integerrima TaxID=434235 RepID=A0ACC0Z209_9ROSI|nr:hypothetical protein Pint_04248 [Pistacia integerrima]